MYDFLLNIPIDRLIPSYIKLSRVSGDQLILINFVHSSKNTSAVETIF